MIIRCEECETRFRLDEARIPERGARVRCSRCDHSFVVRKPTSDAADDEIAASLAREAAKRAAAPVPSNAEAQAAHGSAGESQTVPEEKGGSDDDEDWEFGPSEADVPGAAQPSAKDADPGEVSSSSAASAQEDPPAVENAPPEKPAPQKKTTPAQETAGGEKPAAPAEPSAATAPQEKAAAPQKSEPIPPAAPPQEPEGASAFDINDPFGMSGADLSGTGTLETDDRNFEAAAAGVVEQAAADENEDSLAAVGDPSSWDLLSDDETPADPGTMPSPSAPISPPPHTASAGASAAAAEEEPLFPPTDLFSEGDSLEGPGLGAPHAGAAPAPRDPGVDFLAGYETDAEEPEDDEGPSVFVRIGRGASWVAWPLSIALSVLAAWNLLSPQAPPPSARMVALDHGFEIHSLESRVVENALGGPLLVVSGSLRNGGNHRQALGSALAVTLLGVEGQRLDEAQTLMAPTPDATALREQDPSYLRALGDHTARRMAFHPFVPGEERPYSAVFDGIPGGATRFSVDLLRLPGPPSAPPLVGPLDQGEGLEAAGRLAPVETATAFPSEVLLSRE